MYEYTRNPTGDVTSVCTHALRNVLRTYGFSGRVEFVYSRIFAVSTRFSLRTKRTPRVIMQCGSTTITFRWRGTRSSCAFDRIRMLWVHRSGSTYAAAPCRTPERDANLNNLADDVIWNSKIGMQMDDHPRARVLRCCVLRWRGGSQIISGHLKQPARYPPTFQREREKEREKEVDKIPRFYQPIYVNSFGWCSRIYP